jgi:hypothetical protein
VLVSKQQPDLFERIAVVLGFPAQLLVPAPRTQPDLLPGQRPLAVQLVAERRASGSGWCMHEGDHATLQDARAYVETRNPS